MAWLSSDARAAFLQLAAGLLIGASFIGIGLLFERRQAAYSGSPTETPLNLKYFTAASLLQALATPAFAGLTGFAVGRMGGGLISLPAHGWASLITVACYVLAMDLGEYLFHRAQHLSPFLWAMHSLHHSDRNLNVSTTIRHFWLEHLLKMITVYMAVTLLLKVQPEAVAAYGLITIYNFFLHTNIRTGFGRWSWVLNSPQYHRLHHSILREHLDCNFAALFPVFDVIFRSYRRPAFEEYPPTGLISNERRVSLRDALLWPMRHRLRRTARRQPTIEANCGEFDSKLDGIVSDKFTLRPTKRKIALRFESRAATDGCPRKSTEGDYTC